MGFLDIFKRRSQKESAITKEDLEAAGGTSAGSSGVDLSDGVSLGEMGTLLKKAMSGDIHVTPGTQQNIDLRGTGAREQIIAAMKKHGINPDDHGKTIDVGSVPGLQEDISKILAEHGVKLPGS
jgi:hypothetical protein